jgi:hypothetical protein
MSNIHLKYDSTSPLINNSIIKFLSGTTASTSSIIYDTGTNVGIGTTSPTAKLHVAGNTFVEGDVNILGNVNIVGTATTINTQTLQTADNKIVLNYSGSNLTSIGGGISILSGKTTGESVELITDVNGDWNSNVGLKITGRTADSSSNGLQILNSAGTNTLSVRNDGKVLINTGNTSFYNTAGAAYLDIETYKSFKLRMSGSYGDIMTVSHTVGDITLHRPTIIVGSPTPSGTNTLEVGTTNGASSIGVRNISLDSSASGYGMFAIGKQGTGGSYGNPTMRFIYSPLTFGYSAATTDNNLFRVGIGVDVDDNYRVNIADGLKVSGGTTLINDLILSSITTASTASTVTSLGIDETGKVVTTGISKKLYTALLSQSGTSNPTTIVLEDTKGITGWTRAIAGFYKTLIPGITPTNTMTGFGNWTGNAGTYIPISDQSTILGYYSVYIGVDGEIWLDVFNSSFVYTDLSTLLTTASLPIEIKFYN